MNDKEKLENILKLNEPYIQNNNNGIKTDGHNFKIINGKIPILFSAPHAVRQSRNGITKGADILTGAIVEQLCKTTGTRGIIRTFNLDDDPNYENQGHGLEYKNAILGIIKQNNISCVIDIHGCASGHSFDIDIGTNDGVNINKNKNLLNIINQGLLMVGKISVDRKFKASGGTTISNYIHKNSNIPCFQIEITSEIRRSPDRLLKMLNQFEIIIKELSAEIQKKENQLEL